MAITHSLTISATDWNIIYGVSEAKEYVFDRNYTRDTSPRVLQAQFGDGYEQRVVDGINPLEETFGVTFNNRSYNDLNNLIRYFRLKAGVTPFPIVINEDFDPGDDFNITYDVVCSQWSQVLQHTTNYSITATFRRVYESS
jgi:phage-related protein